MRTVTFKSVFEAILRRHGMDPRGDAVASDTGLAITEHVNARVKRAWFAWEWPEWTITEERAFRQIWNNSRQFYQVGADGKPDEVFYIPNVATHSLVDAAYYRVKTGMSENPPIGTVPTNTLFWEKMDSVDTYVAFDQICRRRIGEVLEVFANNPAVMKPPRELGHRPTENGIQIYDAGGLSTVFVRYLTPAERFTIFPYIDSRTYLRGDVVYLAEQGECYQAIQVAVGKDPATEYSYWRRCLFPEVLAHYVRAGAFADSLRESDTSDERDPVMLQIRGQQSAAADGEAEDEITRQMQRLQAQGQHYSYLPFGVVVPRAGGAGALCTVPGYVLQGGGAYDYGPIAPTGTGTTTIDDRCETEWGYIPPPPPTPPEVATEDTESGIMQLVNGQNYIDVVFEAAQPTARWTFLECQVVNTADATPLNIWPGIVTSRTTTGFRLQLSGIPDSGNYYLHWTIIGAAPAAGEATTYLLFGPASGHIDAPATFAVALPADTSLPAPVTVTPSDGGAGGIFTPTTVALSADTPSATFGYTPGTYGAKTITATNDGGLTDPAGVSFTAVAATYSLSGPSTGTVSVASGNFTVQLPTGALVIGTVTVTPSAGGGGGTFTPATVALTTAAPSATFTYTPASSGTKTISVTNNRGLTNPANLSYAVLFNPLSIAGCKLWFKADDIALTAGSPISNWPESSGNLNHATQTGTARPTLQVTAGYKTVVFIAANSQYFNLTTPITGGVPYTLFMVGYYASGTFGTALVSVGNASVDYQGYGPSISSVFGVSLSRFNQIWNTAAGVAPAGWHLITGNSNPDVWVDAVLKATTYASGTVDSTINNIGWYRPATFSDGYKVELLLYDTVLSDTDRVAVQDYLKAKYSFLP